MNSYHSSKHKEIHHACPNEDAEPKVVNGINVDDLFALIEGVRRDAAKGQTSWRVTTAWQGQTRSRTQVEGFDDGEQVTRRFSIDQAANRFLSSRAAASSFAR